MTPSETFMKEAIRLSFETMRNNTGGPFGAVVVKENKIIARGYNKVISTNDPTAHAEIVAIREACSLLKDFQPLCEFVINSNFLEQSVSNIQYGIFMIYFNLHT